MSISTKKRFRVTQGSSPTDWVQTIEFLPFRMEIFNDNYDVTTAGVTTDAIWEGIDSKTYDVILGENIPIETLEYTKDMFGHVVSSGLDSERQIFSDAITVADKIDDPITAYKVTDISATTNSLLTVSGDISAIKADDELVVTGSTTTTATVNPPQYDGRYIVTSIAGDVITTTRDNTGNAPFTLSANMYIRRRPDDSGVLRAFTGSSRAVVQGRYELTVTPTVLSADQTFLVYIYPYDE